LLDITIDGARGILFNITGGPSLTLMEVNQAAAIIKETAHPDVNLIFGAVIDPNMGDDLRITVIATGFDQAGVRSAVIPQSQRFDPTRVVQRPSFGEEIEPEKEKVNEMAFEPRVIDPRDLNVPAFLRNRLNNETK